MKSKYIKDSVINAPYDFTIDSKVRPNQIKDLNIIHYIEIPKKMNSDYSMCVYIPTIFNKDLGTHGFIEYKLKQYSVTSFFMNRFVKNVSGGEYSVEVLENFLKSIGLKDTESVFAI